MFSLRRGVVARGLIVCGTLLWAQAIYPALAEAQAPEKSAAPKASPAPAAPPGQPAKAPAAAEKKGSTDPAAEKSKPPTPTPATPSVQTGIDRPATPVPADRDDVIVRVLLRGVKTAPQESDLEVGPLASVQQPALLVRPSVKLLTSSAVDGGDYAADLEIKGLIVFGESTAALLHKGRQIELLRFSRPGLVAKPSGEGGFVAREGSPFTMVLENPTAFHYASVRARLRFVEDDICVVKVETFGNKSAPAASPSSSVATPCDQYSSWTTFDIPQYAQVTVRAEPIPSWFVDPDTGFAKTTKRKGWLTLRYGGDGSSSIHEQNVPMEVQFSPSSWSLFRSLSWVFLLLAVGALLSLLLRVWVPNIKRKRQLKDQLNHAADLTASISAEVDSNLRVLLRVERLALDEMRRMTWPFSPAYADYAQRVEQALPLLIKRIDAVRRLDAALNRYRLLIEQGSAPTRLEHIEDLLATVSETLKQDQLSDEDWVFVNQKLEAAQKALSEPTHAEKEAFEAFLAGRWKAIRDHFDVDDATKSLKVPETNLKVPETLKGMKAFPPPPLLPKSDDLDGSKWIQSVGPVRADLQISALTLLWEFEFLAPANNLEGTRWAGPKNRLDTYLATPAAGNLREARSLLRQLAEGYHESDIQDALKRGDATIVLDPAITRPNQKIRFSVRFNNPSLNAAAARGRVSCRWSFNDERSSPRATTMWRWLRPWKAATKEPPTTPLPETGWSVHHYFESDIDQSTVTVSFSDSEGRSVAPGSGTPESPPWWIHIEKPRPSRRGPENWSRLRIEVVQLGAALLVPMATLASSTINGATATQPWDLIAIGFGADTIKNILVGKSE